MALPICECWSDFENGNAVERSYLTDPKVLEDQLTGVDSAYFVQLLNRLAENNPEKINTAYLVEIIDRMF